MASSKKSRLKKPPKKAARKSKIRDISENEIHFKCAKWVRETHPGLLIFHVANERRAPVQYHVKLKRLGVLKGVADFLAFPGRNRGVAIELKDDKGEQDADQIEFQKQWESAGGSYYLVRTVEDFQRIIDGVTLFG